MRLQRATARARRAGFDWRRIAHERGYHDQAHLIRDFGQLAGVAPSDLARARVHPKEQHQRAVSEG